MGHHFRKFGQNFLFGNYLSGRSSAPQPDPHVTTPKRVNEVALENPPKRPRTDDDTSHEIHSTPSSSGLPEKSVAVSSAQRKGVANAPSLRSSADRSANGRGLEEYRNTEHRGGVGKVTRQRRKDKARRHSNSLTDDGLEMCLQKTSPTAPYKTRRSLVYLQRPSNDPIQDDEDIEEINGAVARKSVINGRRSANTGAGNAVYTASTFEVPESDDELNADQPVQPNPRPQRQTGSSGQSTTGRKRPAEIEIDEGAQILPQAKRRAQPADRADMHRTTFVSAAARVGDKLGGLRVIKAVCEPTHVYQVGEGVHGANENDCVLVPSVKGNSPFEAVDGVTRSPIAELVWLTPKASKVTQISHARNSMTVKISKSSETSKGFSTGSTLYLQFGNAHEAAQFVRRVCKVSNITVKDDMRM